MILLISTERNTHFSIAIGDQSGLKKMKTINKAYKQSELLLAEIDGLVKLGTLSAIFVINGPGDFSALRIGISTANALAYAWSIPVIGVKLEKDWIDTDEKERLQTVWKSGVELLEKFKKTTKVQFVVPEYDREPNIG